MNPKVPERLVYRLVPRRPCLGALLISCSCIRRLFLPAWSRTFSRGTPEAQKTGVLRIRPMFLRQSSSSSKVLEERGSSCDPLLCLQCSINVGCRAKNVIGAWLPSQVTPAGLVGTGCSKTLHLSGDMHQVATAYIAPG